MHRIERPASGSYAPLLWKSSRKLPDTLVKSQFPVRALSLTTPTVSRDFVGIFSVYEHTFPVARESRLDGHLVSLVSP